ncbi:hypothetical protein D046_0809A, partial [Vibrio parahaemolyticus V-223/04]
MVQFLLILS